MEQIWIFIQSPTIRVGLRKHLMNPQFINMLVPHIEYNKDKTMPTSIIEDKVEAIGKWNIIHVRQATIITDEEGNITSHTFNRRVIVPGTDVSSESDVIKALVTEHHSDELISNYIEYLEDPIGNL